MGKMNLSRFVSISSVIFSLLFSCINAYVLSTDPRYSKWPGNTVPYIIAPDYSVAELNTIHMAADQIQQDMGSCVRFVEVDPRSIPPNTNFVVISKSGGPGIPSQTCYSFPGRVLSTTNPPTFAQHMAIINGPNGCLSSVRHVMRFFTALLGLRSEHNKPGRDQFVQINMQTASPSALQVNAFVEYQPNLVVFNATDFDYNSISILDPMTYSTNGLPIIVARNGMPIYNAGRLSFRDCTGLSAMYGCTARCPLYY